MDGVVGDVVEPHQRILAGVVGQRDHHVKPTLGARVAVAVAVAKRVGVGRALGGKHVPGLPAVGRCLKVQVVPVLLDVVPEAERQRRFLAA